MKVKVEGQAAEEVIEDQPAGDGSDQPIVDESPKDLQEQLVQEKIERARLEGELKGRTATPAVDPNAANAQLKQQVWADANNLTDEEFQDKWKKPKHIVTTAFLENDLKNVTTSQKQQMAELRAENRLAAKYKDFYDVKAEVDEMVEQASVEVRQDPERLAKFMEKAYIAARGGKPEPKERQAGGGPVNRSKISGGFERPNAGREPAPIKEEEPDQVPAEYRELGRHFGITSEKERKALMASDTIPMDLGNGMMLEGRILVKKNAAA